MKKLLLLSALFLFRLLDAQPQIHELSQARKQMCAATIGDSIFFAGGMDTSSAVDIYNSITGTWSSGTLAAPKMKAAARQFGNKTYFVNGQGYNLTAQPRIIDIFDRSTQQWSVDTFPASLQGYVLSVSSNDSTLVIVSDGNNFSSTVIGQCHIPTGTWLVDTLPGGIFGAHTTVHNNEVLWVPYEAYPVSVLVHFNLITRQTSYDTLPEQVVQPYICSLGNKTFISGGQYYSPQYPRQTMLVYDHTNGTFTSSSQKISGDHQIVIYGQKIMFAGGTYYSNNNIQHAGELLFYDGLTDSFTTYYLPQIRGYFGVGAGCGRFYVAGGWNYAPAYSVNDLDYIDTSSYMMHHTTLSTERDWVTVGRAGMTVVFAGGGGMNYMAASWNVTDTCDVYTDCLSLSVAGQTKENNSWTLMPNPANTVFTLSREVSDEDELIRIYTSTGAVISEQKTSSALIQIDCSAYAPGLYFVLAGRQIIPVVKE